MASVELSKMGGTDVPPAGPADDAHAVTIEGGEATKPESEDSSDDMSKMSTMWLGICFAGIMGTLRNSLGHALTQLLAHSFICSSSRVESSHSLTRRVELS
mmetsp:Transcript_17661/g.46157  ORF Transcript_17661/g.46157 Transcript_17661/m.46157 type:complete len:101 (-) Transcript_17661:167-469(-)